MKEPTLIDDILAPGALCVCFQPIFELRQPAHRLHALEALTRGPRGTNVEPPQVLFEYVRRKREEVRVDRACVGAALAALAPIAGDFGISVNVHAATLDRDRDFPGFLGDTAHEHGMRLSRLIVEIVEDAPFSGGPAFLKSLATLRDMGVHIALDDVGLGQSNYRRILDCHPDYFKMDRYFVSASHADLRRQAVLESAAFLARKLGAQVVAEGVEDVRDLRTLERVGIDLVQGYLLGRPAPVSQLVADGILGHAPPGTAPGQACAPVARGSRPKNKKVPAAGTARSLGDATERRAHAC